MVCGEVKNTLMNLSLLKKIFTTDNKKLEENRKRRQAKADAEKEKAKWNVSYGNLLRNTRKKIKIGIIHL